MTRDEARAKAWADWHKELAPELVPMAVNRNWDMGFDAGWDARQPPNLQPVIVWLERGCNPAEAAKELRIYQAQRDAE